MHPDRIERSSAAFQAAANPSQLQVPGEDDRTRTCIRRVATGSVAFPPRPPDLVRRLGIDPSRPNDDSFTDCPVSLTVYRRKNLEPTVTNRTDDRPLTKRLLYQLSYAGKSNLVACEGLEPPRLTALRSKRSVSANFTSRPKLGSGGRNQTYDLSVIGRLLCH